MSFDTDAIGELKASWLVIGGNELTFSNSADYEPHEDMEKNVSATAEY